MPSTIISPEIKKVAYQRPYKTRRQRREIDRRKQDEANDYKFLVRIASAIGLLLVVALGIALKGIVGS
jgi:hypothetical protein